MEFSLLGAVFVAVIPLYLVIYWEAKRGNAASCARSLWDVALAAMVAGIFVGRLAAMIGDGVNPLQNPADILIVRGGVATGPATIAALATVAWLGRTEVLAYADGLAAAALAGLGGWHAGCVVRESCLGTPSDLPWAVAQGGSSITRHPVEIYAAIALFIAAGALAFWRARGRPRPGVPAASALLIAAFVRLLTEPMRPSLGTGQRWWYAAGIAVAIVALVVSMRRGDQPDQPASDTR
ncbi:MAG: prolipoprotein diacylglyceryl transferase [Acidimicrobiia bacterium]|nr:prolipoprotein diacylglyceryl transferase [Acidimicrobiia bacterium]